MSLKDLRDRLERGVSIAPSLSEELINRVVPVIVLENLLGFDESAPFEVRFCVKPIQVVAAGGNFAADIIFNLPRSGIIGIVTAYHLASSVATNDFLTGTTGTQQNPAGAATEFRDSRMTGAPTLVSQQRTTTIISPDRAFHRFVGSHTMIRSRQDPIAILGPGQGWLMTNRVAGANTITGYVEWTEIFRKQAPGP